MLDDPTHALATWLGFDMERYFNKKYKHLLSANGLAGRTICVTSRYTVVWNTNSLKYPPNNYILFIS
jgi:hypothetical protein